MSDNQDQQKRSFVSDKDATPPVEEKKEVPTIEINGKKTPILRPEVSLMLCYGKLCEVLSELKSLNDIFKQARQASTFAVPAQHPEPPKVDNPPIVNPLQMPQKSPEQSPRVKEILAALEPVKDLLKIDTETSAMLIIVKPASFLGSENFAKVGSIVRSLGGQYVSAGKASHFEISKAPLKK